MKDLVKLRQYVESTQRTDASHDVSHFSILKLIDSIESLEIKDKAWRIECDNRDREIQTLKSALFHLIEHINEQNEHYRDWDTLVEVAKKYKVLLRD